MIANEKLRDYIRILYGLSADIMTLSCFRKLCPHLDEIQTESLYELAKLIPEGIIIPFPPLKVREIRQIICLTYNGSGSYTLRRVGVERAELIVPSGNPLRSIISKQAQRYSEEYLPDELLSIKDFQDYVEIWLEDPTGIDQERFIHFVTRKKWQDIISDDTKPISQALQENIVTAVADPFRGAELRLRNIDHPIRVNCLWCGGGISSKGCESNHCESGETLPEEYKPYLWRTPLPPKLVEVLKKSGHEFEIPPEIARQQEKLQWEL